MPGESITVEPVNTDTKETSQTAGIKQATLRENIIYITNVVVRTKKTIHYVSIKRVSVAEQVSIV